MKLKLLKKIRSDYPNLSFKQGGTFYWSPEDKTVYYTMTDDSSVADWSLLHEVSHGILGHTNYRSDFDLIKLEVEAWDYANVLADRYDIKIDQDHVQDCLDTYRDWLHRRSTCPTCGTVSPQKSDAKYVCINCGSEWKVSSSRFCRPYRKTARN